MTEKYDMLLLEYKTLKEQYEILSIYAKELELSVITLEERIANYERLQS